MMTQVVHLTMDELEAGLDVIRAAPKMVGRLEMIVRRPGENEREVLSEGQLDHEYGLVGDTWRTRGSSRTDDGSSHPDMQLNVMNARVAELVAQERERWALAGDQLFVDMDISDENMPPGTRLAIGNAIIEVTDQPHNGCKKFVARFGLDAMKWVNSPVGKQLHLRGINARVVQAGVIREGDTVTKV